MLKMPGIVPNSTITKQHLNHDVVAGYDRVKGFPGVSWHMIHTCSLNFEFGFGYKSDCELYKSLMFEFLAGCLLLIICIN